MIAREFNPLLSRAYVGAGSNLGDRREMLRTAARLLSDVRGVMALESSPVYETRPVGPTGQEHFLNAVFRVSVRLSPLQLFSHLQAIETRLGRRPPRTGPRPIDLDLLFYDDLVFESESLIVPHPRAHLRAFVLAPLCDLDSQYCHPEFGYSIRELRDALPPEDEVVGRVADSVLTVSTAIEI